MAVSKTMTSRQMSGHMSMDTDPLSPQNDNRSPIFSLSSNNMSADALAGPQDASRRSTQELKQEAKHAGSRPEHLSIEKLPPKSVSRSRSGQRDELDQVESEVQAQIHDKLEDMSINKGQDSSYSSMSSGDSFSCSSMPSANWDDELKEYRNEMPPDIRMGYIDVLILYCEEDLEQAQKFQQHLREEIDVPNGPVQTLLYDDADMQAICGSKIQHLAKGVERSTYVFIFMTKNFIEDKWCEFSSESCLMEAITNPSKQWCVVPVYTEKRNSSFRVPMGLNTLKGINYYNNDRFYKNGVARLIGDKTCVRVQANEEHKIKQKKWLEDYKRKQILIKEQQRRLQEYEKAQTQQLLDWLDEETKILIHAGLLPNYLHHSFSESDISSHDSTMSHSSSSSSLKPVHSQNPAVTKYFQELIGQLKVYNYNPRNYSPEQIRIIEQVYGSTSPVTPGYPNHVSPSVMNPYQGQSPGQFGPGQYGPGQGFFPPVQNSVSYQQQYQHHVKRSTSQTSADMGPSTEFILHSETGDVSVNVPSVLVERIKDLPEDAQQEKVKFYLREMATQQQQQREQQQYQQTVANQQRIAAQNQYVPSQRLSPFEMENRNRSQVISPGGAYSQSSFIYQRNSNTVPEGVPKFDVLEPSMNSGSYRTGSTYNETSRSMQSGLSSQMESKQPGPSVGQLGSNMDGNRSQLQGNLPNHSLLEHDAGTSLSSRAYPSVPECQEQVYQTEKVKETQSDSESDEDTPKESRKKRKGKGKHIHIHKTYIYQPKNVQIGDHNVVQEASSENEGFEDEEIVAELPVPGNKTGVGNDSPVSSEEKQQMMKVDIKPGSETHGEIQEQPNSAGASSSCHVDAAPSTVRNLPSGVPQVQHATKLKLLTQELTTIKSAKEEDIEEAEEVLPDVKNVEHEYSMEKKFENSSKFDDDNNENLEQKTRFEESVNLNSTFSTEKSSSLKRKEMPFEENFQKQDVKPTCVAKPVAAVQPFSPTGADDDYDNNCDNTDPKTLVKTSQTTKKTVLSNSEGAYSSEQTYVKQAWGVDNTAPSARTRTEQMQRNIPVQVLTKTVDSGDTVRNGSANFSISKHPDPQKLFFSKKSPTVVTNDDDIGNAVNVPGRQEVALGNDPLTRETQEEPASKSFIPQSSPFTPNATPTDDDDLEFDFIKSESYETAEYPNQNSSSFEESGTKLSKSWNRKGSPTGNGKKECVIS